MSVRLICLGDCLYRKEYKNRNKAVNYNRLQLKLLTQAIFALWMMLTT